nr:immunoglobulin heavy chain junction region [Mus musculus]
CARMWGQLGDCYFDYW